jgi:hypothetical protein
MSESNSSSRRKVFFEKCSTKNVKQTVDHFRFHGTGGTFQGQRAPVSRELIETSRPPVDDISILGR